MNKSLQLFKLLRRHGKLAEKRHPMYDLNRFGKIVARVGGFLMAAYLIFLGVVMAISMSDSSREAYHLIGAVFIPVMMLDFIARFPMQKTPTQEIKPYLLMPVKRNRVIDFLLLRSASDGFNLIWIFFFAPFAFLSVFRFYGLLGVVLFCIGTWLLMIFNNYWFLLCKTLGGECIAWYLLPIAVYGGLVAAIFVPDDSPVFYAFMHLSDGFVRGNPLAFGIVILLVVLLFQINRAVMVRLFYNEVNKVEDTKVRTSDYNFFERYGEVGEYMRLELKMLLRNKACKAQLRTIGIVVALFSSVLAFSDVYDGGMRLFITVYNFGIFGMVYLSSLMSYEGNYIDGLMSRKESIHTLLTAKYIFYGLAMFIPGILMIPTVVMGKVQLMALVGWILFTAGPIYCILFQLAVYNNKTTPLNVKLTGRQNMGTGIQNMIALGAFGLPLLIYPLLLFVAGETLTNIILSLIGLAFIATHKYWIRNVYNRFMIRRYKNMEGFRDSRVK